MIGSTRIKLLALLFVVFVGTCTVPKAALADTFYGGATVAGAQGYWGNAYVFTVNGPNGHSTYAANSQQTFTGSVYTYVCSNYWGVGSVSASLTGNTNYAPNQNLSFGISSVSTSDHLGVTGVSYGSATFTMPSSLGPTSITFTGTFFTGYTSSCVYQPQQCSYGGKYATATCGPAGPPQPALPGQCYVVYDKYGGSSMNSPNCSCTQVPTSSSVQYGYPFTVVASDYGQSCTSAANACGQTNTGTYDTNGNCTASTPSNSRCAQPTGSVSPSSCTIAAGASTCASSFTWTTANSYIGNGGGQLDVYASGTGCPWNDPNGGSACGPSGNYSAWTQNTNYWDGVSGGSTITIPYGTYIAALYGSSAGTGNWVTLAYPTFTASCTTGSSWNGSTCFSQPTVPTVTLTGQGCVLPADGLGCNISATWTVLGLPLNSLVDLLITNPDGSKTSFVGLPPDPSQPDLVKNPGPYTIQLINHSTGAPLGSTIALAACPSGSTVIAGNPESCGCPAGSTLDTSTNAWACVSTASAPTCSTFSASPISIPLGQSLTIKWSCQNTSSCTAVSNGDGFSTGGSPSGHDNTVTPSSAGQVTYSMVCGGKNFYSNSVTVVSSSGNVTISANPTRVASRGSTSITATPTDMNSCKITKNNQPWQSFNANASGTMKKSYTDTNLTSQTTYVVTCTGGASASATANVTVTVIPSFSNF